ncbi:pyridoxal phosphate-dependent aminotransferase [Xanthocytophaga agilis]|uniref:Pyridoxal phosphate-dependent aminotransferase n=1 Tax=Xanthocytophaga agilis TaxID=3048010 RepID=A0AAE3R0N5_9BACT|nr:pyridoxal phosphate-dependent aminotransferase [Xanthocytophaga agilis]MDJ1499255.1 pyridoxal phosphate-dependent aminotransferase [Xanthocytophaga agilis]
MNHTQSNILSSKLPNVGTTIFTVMSKLAQEHKAINLGQGFPDFNASQDIIQLVTKAMQDGYNQYAPMPGTIELREQIAIKTERMYGYAPNPDTEITVTSGGTEALYAAISAIVSPGDEVIVLEPCYDSYVPAIELNGGIPVFVSLSSDDFSINFSQLQNAITSRTRAIIINTPHNPTGTTLTQKDLQFLAILLRDRNIYLISDEVYEHIIFDGQQHQSVLRHAELRERSFVISSFGKTYHVTGWKLGYCIAPRELSTEFRKVHQYLTFSSFTPLQIALAEYLRNPEPYESLPQFYQQKRDFFVNLMQQTRFSLLPSRGSYFVLASYGHITDESDTDYAIRLTKEIGVATIPLSVFYNNKTDNKLLRFCYAKKEETLERAVERLMKI